LVLGRTQFTLAELSPFSHTQCLNAQNRNLDTSALLLDTHQSELLEVHDLGNLVGKP
jgi:hypothetical protein